MAYIVKTVRDRRTMNDFLDLPFHIYANDPLWVAPLRSEVRRVLDEKRNPYFRGAKRELFVCYRDNTPSARVAIVVSRIHEQRFGERVATFGFFESFDDSGATHCLLEEAVSYCEREGVTALEGPFNPHHYSEIGFQCNKFDIPPAFFQPYNPPFYLRLLEEAGFRILRKLHTCKSGPFDAPSGPRLQNIGNVNSGEYTLRTLREDDLEGELERIREVFNDAFESNWRFLPLSREEYLFSAKFLKLVTFPELVLIVEHRGRPVGVLECVLDINPLLRPLNGRAGPIKYLRFRSGRKRVRTLILYAGGVKKAYRKTRVIALLFNEFCRLSRHYDTFETTWMSPDNVLAARIAEALGMERDKEFAVYCKELKPSPAPTDLLPVDDNSVANLPDGGSTLVTNESGTVRK